MITPCLWFDSDAESAATFYSSIFPRSKITQVTRYPEGAPRPAGTVMTVLFELDGQPFIAINGGPAFHFTEAISLTLRFDTQAELDAMNAKLIDGGGAQKECGWVKDKYGLSWQLVPRMLDELVTGDAARTERVMTRLWKMHKLDLAALKQAADGK